LDFGFGQTQSDPHTPLKRDGAILV
jgi:hypothetical protein